MTIKVTDALGETIPGVHVDVLGLSDRRGETGAGGQISFTGMQAGTYRVRFSGETVITLEREIALRAGQTAGFDIMLNTEKPRPTPAVPPPPDRDPIAAPVGPPGQPQILSILNLVEHELIGSNTPRRDTLLACSGNTRTTLVQVNQDQPPRMYESAEITYYVVAGEGAVRLDGRDAAVGASSYVSLPRGTSHALVRRGRRPLILLATLSGAPCEEAR
jgi:mannose-6-phosphate isomerase-like protein (cupin superfamily)